MHLKRYRFCLKPFFLLEKQFVCLNYLHESTEKVYNFIANCFFYTTFAAHLNHFCEIMEVINGGFLLVNVILDKMLANLEELLKIVKKEH